MRRSLLLFVTVAAAAVMPAIAQTANEAPAVPDFSGVWTHPAFPWFEPPASGPGPITNLSRWPEQRPSGASGSAALPPSATGISDYDQLVGDYKSPLLQPWAAQIVKRFGEQSLAGITFPNPSNQCWPHPVPFIFKQFTMQVIQQEGRVVMLYSGDHEVRRVRMNAAHPASLKPSWYGDSVGRYEGDTLIIDTVGVKVDRPYAMQDLFGTPYTDKLHIVERYSLRGYDDVKDALERNEKENWLFNGDVFSKHRGKFLQVHVTIEDEGVFTAPWTATMTYVPSATDYQEGVCSENPHDYNSGKDTDVPKSAKPDF